ncbi:MAG TPA: carboxylesterase [Erysipelotrichaceae bacterium]|nr:carboxylesterase [Erysipelotrichaceae bacterium]
MAKGFTCTSDSPVVETKAGKLRGFELDDTYHFYGIPYGKAKRWEQPEPADCWEGVKDALAFGYICPPFNPDSPNGDILIPHRWWPKSEDCLNLNIWTPSIDRDAKKPVMVWLHGGLFADGSSVEMVAYDGENLAHDGDLVFVSLNHRMGPYGFLNVSRFGEKYKNSQNCGLADMVLALQWIHDNIEAFGGDPNNVTLIGESAGAVCVDALCVSPLAEGLFQRAILESSTLSSPQPPHSYRSFADALASGKALKEKYGCETLAELRDLPASKITGEMETQHHVTADGYVLADDPYELRKQGVHNEQAILHGFNDQESGPFIIFSRANKKNYEEKVRRYFGEYTDDVLALYPASTDAEADRNWAEIYGALFFNYSHYCLNRLAAQENIPVYEYLFTKQNGRLSSWHSGEMVYTFGVIPEESDLYDYEDRRLSEIMHTFWVNFITTGNPNGEELPDFEENTTSEKIMVFGETEEMRSEPYLKLYEILDRMTGFKN